MRTESSLTLNPRQQLLSVEAIFLRADLTLSSVSWIMGIYLRLLFVALTIASAPPRGLVLLLTGVICASGIDVVCWPIKIFEGNVYFLERIVPAACKPFWIRPFMCKNLPLWGIVQDLSLTECWFGPLQRKWRSSRGSKDLTHAESTSAIGEQPSTASLSASGILLSPNCHYRRLGFYYIAGGLLQRRTEP